MAKFLKAIGNARLKNAQVKKINRESKAKLINAKANAATKKKLNTIARTAMINATLQHTESEKTKRAQAAANKEAELAKWNALMTMSNDSAEGTSSGNTGSTGITVIGNE